MSFIFIYNIIQIVRHYSIIYAYNYTKYKIETLMKVQLSAKEYISNFEGLGFQLML
jgi:hypothetical protein